MLLAAIMLLSCSSMMAAEPHKTHAYMIGVGHTDILDTYLSPEKYRGTDLRFMSHMRREKDSTAWVRLIAHEGNIAFADNRSGNGGEIGGGYVLRYALMRKWRIEIGQRPMLIMAGGTLAANIGFLYNTRGSNNPAQARLSLHIEPTLAADFPIGRASHMAPFALAAGDCAHYMLMLHYEVSVPMAGLMFSPNYGQSYYEIFSRGNYDHNVVPTTIGCTPGLRHMLSVDFRLLHTTWRIGYLGDWQQAKVNGLKQHNYLNAVVLGVVKTLH